MFNTAYWLKRHGEGYAKAAWRDKPSPFAEFTLPFIDGKSSLLELGAGVGQDGIWFAERGFEVTLTELGEVGLKVAEETAESKGLQNIKVTQLDMSKPYPFPDNSFDVVYAHSCIQYFTEEDTRKIFQEIHRVLKPEGVLAVLVNSVNDLEYGTGPETSRDYFEVKGLQKRYFTTEALKGYVGDLFKIKFIDDKGESYKDQEVGNHGMVRLVAGKSEMLNA